MATSKILGTGGYKTSILTCPIAGASLSHNSCWSDGNVVTISLTISNIDVVANGIVANVPQGFRPRGDAARGIGFLNYDDGTLLPCLVSINNSGEVYIGVSASHHMTSLDFASTYGIH